MTLTHRIGLALLSGFSAYPAGRLGDRLEELLPLPFSSWTNILVGAVFGALVLGVRAALPGRGWRVPALIVASILIYTLAVWLAVIGYGPLNLGSMAAIIASGGLGAVLAVGAAIFLAPLTVRARVWPCALAAGVVGGTAFQYAINVNVEPELVQGLVIGAGYAAWQVLLCIALEMGSSVRTG